MTTPIVCFDLAPENIGERVHCDLDKHGTSAHYSVELGVSWADCCGCDPKYHVEDRMRQSLTGFVCENCGDCTEPASVSRLDSAMPNYLVMGNEDTWLDHDLDAVKNQPWTHMDWPRTLAKAVEVALGNRQNTAQNIALRAASRRVIKAWREACARAGSEAFLETVEVGS